MDSPKPTPIPKTAPFTTAAGAFPEFSLRHLWPLLVVLLAGALCYWPVLHFPFTNWDDILFIGENPLLQAPGWHSLRRIFTPGGVPQELLFLPLTYLTYMLESLIHKLQPGAVHGFNLFLHLVNTALVWLVLRHWLRDGRRLAATLGAALFLLHPIQVEAVVWAMGRKDLLATCLGLLALLAWQRQENQREAHHWLGLALLGYGAACLAKPSLIVLPGVLMLSSWYRKGRLEAHVWGNQIPFILVGLLIYMMNHLVPHPSLPGAPSLLFRLLTVPVVVAEWCLRLLLVQPPVPFYSWPPETALGVMGWTAMVVLALGAGGLTWLLWRSRPALQLGVGVIVIMALPAVTITLGYREFTTADRYGYFAMLGLSWLLALAVRAMRRQIVVAAPAGEYSRLHRWRLLGFNLVCLFLLACAVQTRKQMYLWQDSETLWRAVLASYPNSLTAKHNLALTMAEKGHLNEAAQLLQQVIRAQSQNGQAVGNLGRVMLDLDRVPEAVRYLSQGVELAPSAKTWKSLGDANLRLNQLRKAIEAYLQAVRLLPSYSDAWNALGIAYRNAGMPQDAEKAWLQGIALGTPSTIIFFNLGLLYEHRQDLAQARLAYTQAIRLDPKFQDATYNLGNIYLRQGFFAEARQAFGAVLHMRPDNRQAKVNLAIAQMQLHQWSEAEQNLQQALAAGADFANVHYYLGQIRQQRGQNAAAAAFFRRALELQPDFTPAQQALDSLPPP
jgi:protein O-mannosyl-transferase